jgi:RimJ/RimL family protein N-acetyltransferase
MLTHPSSDREASRRSVEVSKRSAGRWDADFHPVLATPAARLRKLRPDDRCRLVEIFDEQRRTEGTIDAPHHFDADTARRWIAARMAEEEMGYALHWAVCLLSEDGLVGYVGLQDIDFQHRQAELCFWLENLHGSGEFQLDVAHATLAFAFTTMELNSIRALSTPGRIGPAGVLTALGMRQLQPTSTAGTVWTRLDDVHIWTITKHHWAEQLGS